MNAKLVLPDIYAIRDIGVGMKLVISDAFTVVRDQVLRIVTSVTAKYVKVNAII